MKTSVQQRLATISADGHGLNHMFSIWLHIFNYADVILLPVQRQADKRSLCGTLNRDIY
jgi:hypothetical protein